MDEVRRLDDGELCGFVDHDDDGWLALVVFGVVIGRHASREAAEQQVLHQGLASLAERWTLRGAATGEDEIVCIQEAHTAAVTVARGYYSLPGVPTLTITAAELARGTWQLLRR